MSWLMNEIHQHLGEVIDFSAATLNFAHPMEPPKNTYRWLVMLGWHIPKKSTSIAVDKKTKKQKI